MKYVWVCTDRKGYLLVKSDWAKALFWLEEQKEKALVYLEEDDLVEEYQFGLSAFIGTKEGESVGDIRRYEVDTDGIGH